MSAPPRLLGGDGRRAPRRHPSRPVDETHPGSIQRHPRRPNLTSPVSPSPHHTSDVNETYSGELRLQLFKRKSIMGDKAAVANAGVYVKNVVSYINSNGSIDKEFKLFSKEGEALGGNVRLKIDFKPADPTTPLPTDTAVHGGMKSHAYTEDEAAAKLQARFRGMKTRKELDEKKKKGGVKGAVVAVVAVAVAGAGAMLVRKRGKEKR